MNGAIDASRTVLGFGDGVGGGLPRSSRRIRVLLVLHLEIPQ